MAYGFALVVAGEWPWSTSFKPSLMSSGLALTRSFAGYGKIGCVYSSLRSFLKPDFLTTRIDLTEDSGYMKSQTMGKPFRHTSGSQMMKLSIGWYLQGGERLIHTCGNMSRTNFFGIPVMQNCTFIFIMVFGSK